MTNHRDSHVRLFSLLIACFAVSSLSCGPTKQPKPDELIGFYRITSDSLKYLTPKGYKDIPPIAISIESNGTIRLENIPDCVFDLSGESRGKFLTRTARWKCCAEFLDSLGRTSFVDRHGRRLRKVW